MLDVEAVVEDPLIAGYDFRLHTLGQGFQTVVIANYFYGILREKHRVAIRNINPIAATHNCGDHNAVCLPKVKLS